MSHGDKEGVDGRRGSARRTSTSLYRQGLPLKNAGQVTLPERGAEQNCRGRMAARVRQRHKGPGGHEVRPYLLGAISHEWFCNFAEIFLLAGADGDGEAVLRAGKGTGIDRGKCSIGNPYSPYVFYTSTMSPFKLETNATTSSRSCWGTFNACIAAPACSKNIDQSVSLILIPL